MFKVTSPSVVCDKAKSLHAEGMRVKDRDKIHGMMKADKDLLAKLERERCSLGDYMDHLMSWLGAFSKVMVYSR